MSKEIRVSQTVATKAKALRAGGKSRRETAKALKKHHGVIRAIENGTAIIEDNANTNS